LATLDKAASFKGPLSIAIKSAVDDCSPSSLFKPREAFVQSYLLIILCKALGQHALETTLKSFANRVAKQFLDHWIIQILKRIGFWADIVRKSSMQLQFGENIGGQSSFCKKDLATCLDLSIMRLIDSDDGFENE
jgi:hypothetical protein